MLFRLVFLCSYKLLKMLMYKHVHCKRYICLFNRNVITLCSNLLFNERIVKIKLNRIPKHNTLHNEGGGGSEGWGRG